MCIFKDKSVGYIIQLLQWMIFIFSNPTFSLIQPNSNPKPHAMSHKLHFGFCFQSARHETTRGSIRALFYQWKASGVEYILLFTQGKWLDLEHQSAIIFA